MTSLMAHKGVSTDSLSPRIWGNLPIKNWSCGLGGFFFYDDFRGFGKLDGTGYTVSGGSDSTLSANEQNILDVLLRTQMQNGSQNGYSNFLTAGTTNASGVILSQLATESSGVIRVTGNDADQDGSCLQYGTAGCVKVNKEANDPKALAFEARVRLGSVTNDAMGWFLGLAQEGLNSANGVMAHSTAIMADIDHIGFHQDLADGDAIDFVYTLAGETDTIQIAGVQVPAITSATTPNTAWYKLGFLFNPGAPPANRIRIFVDNVEQSTYITETEIAASDFPEGEEMTPTWATTVGGASAITMDMDWWAVGQAH